MPEELVQETKKRTMATRVQKELRIERCIQLLSNMTNMRTASICVKLAEEFGLCFRQAQRYIDMARKRMVEATGRSREEHRVTIYNGLMEVIGSNPGVKERLKALNQLAMLTGANAPMQHEVVTQNVTPLYSLEHQKKLLENPELALKIAEIDAIVLESVKDQDAHETFDAVGTGETCDQGFSDTEAPLLITAKSIATTR